jgi:hypothetical protein
MKWNNCKEGQPDTSGRYLVINVNAQSYKFDGIGEDVMTVANWENDRYRMGEDPNNELSRWYLTDGELEWLEGEPTHWMHLPYPPTT